MTQLQVTVVMDMVAATGPRLAEPAVVAGSDFGAVMAAAIGLAGRVPEAPMMLLAGDNPASGNTVSPVVEPTGAGGAVPVMAMMVPRMPDDNAATALPSRGKLAPSSAHRPTTMAGDASVSSSATHPDRARPGAASGEDDGGGAAFVASPLPQAVPALPVLAPPVPIPSGTQLPVALAVEEGLPPALVSGPGAGDDMSGAAPVLVPRQSALDMPPPPSPPPSPPPPVAVAARLTPHVDAGSELSVPELSVPELSVPELSVMARSGDVASNVRPAIVGTSAVDARPRLIKMPAEIEPAEEPRAPQPAGPASQVHIGRPGADGMMAPEGLRSVMEPPHGMVAQVALWTNPTDKLTVTYPRDRPRADDDQPVRHEARLEPIPVPDSAPHMPRSGPVSHPMPDLATAGSPVGRLPPDTVGLVTPDIVDVGPGPLAGTFPPRVPRPLVAAVSTMLDAAPDLRPIISIAARLIPRQPADGEPLHREVAEMRQGIGTDLTIPQHDGGAAPAASPVRVPWPENPAMAVPADTATPDAEAGTEPVAMRAAHAKTRSDPAASTSLPADISHVASVDMPVAVPIAVSSGVSQIASPAIPLGMPPDMSTHMSLGMSAPMRLDLENAVPGSAPSVAGRAEDTPPPAVAQVARAMVGLGHGTQHLALNLHPDSLGSVQIRIVPSAHAGPHVEITVGRAETLTLLRADTHALHQALDAAGFSPVGRDITLHWVPPQGAFAGEAAIDFSPASTGGDSGQRFTPREEPPPRHGVAAGGDDDGGIQPGVPASAFPKRRIGPGLDITA